MENRFNQEFKWACPVMDDDVEDLYKLNYGDNAGRAYCRAITSGAYEMAVISRLIAYLDFKLMMREMRREQDNDPVPDYMSDYICTANDDCDGDCDNCECNKACKTFDDEGDDEDFDLWKCFTPDSGKPLFTPEEDAEDLMDMSFVDRILKKMEFSDDIKRGDASNGCNENC